MLRSRLRGAYKATLPTSQAGKTEYRCYSSIGQDRDETALTARIEFEWTTESGCSYFTTTTSGESNSRCDGAEFDFEYATNRTKLIERRKSRMASSTASSDSLTAKLDRLISVGDVNPARSVSEDSGRTRQASQLSRDHEDGCQWRRRGRLQNQ